MKASCTADLCTAVRPLDHSSNTTAVRTTPVSAVIRGESEKQEKLLIVQKLSVPRRTVYAHRPHASKLTPLPLGVVPHARIAHVLSLLTAAVVFEVGRPNPHISSNRLHACWLSVRRSLRTLAFSFLPAYILRSIVFILEAHEGCAKQFHPFLDHNYLTY